MTDNNIPKSPTRVNLDEIKARCEAATPGPWKKNQATIHGCDLQAGTHCISFLGFANGADADAEFVAHSRTDIPALLAYIERLEKEKAWLIDVFADMACPPPAYRLKECSGLGRDFGICAQCLSEASEKAVGQ